MDFYVDCLGACREVGRSAFLLHTDKNIMIDYGIKLFDESGDVKFPIPSPAKPDITLISHAHLDHSGCLPMMYSKGRMRWYSTPPTKDICEILWKDSLKIMGENAPYQAHDMKRALRNWDPLLYGKAIQMGESRIKLYDAGHISGAAMVEVEYKGRNFLYTGDFKCEDTFMHKGARYLEGVDVLVMETTYAKREHPPRKETEKRLMEQVHEAVESGGNALLPSFALGRTQELISLIRHYDKDIPVFVDGMGRAITKIYMQYPRYIRNPEQFRKAVRSVNMVESPRERRLVLREPSVVISSAGMLNGGPMLNYLFHANRDSKLLFTGWCVEGTNGWLLQNKGTIMQEDEELNVDLPVDYLDLSAHAGRKDLMEFIKRANPEKIILVHGDMPEDFAAELREEHGYDAMAPLPGERVML